MFFLSAVLNAQSSYQVSLYGKINFCKITMGEKMVISPTKTGEMFFEPLKYKQEDFNENSLILSLLSNKSIDIQDTVWEKDVTLVKNFPCQIRFLEAGNEAINKKETTLYRLDIKLLEETPDKEMEILNTVLLESSVIKVWISKEGNNIVKISINYKGLEYIITQNNNLDEERAK